LLQIWNVTILNNVCQISLPAEPKTYVCWIDWVGH